MSTLTWTTPGDARPGHVSPDASRISQRPRAASQSPINSARSGPRLYEIFPPRTFRASQQSSSSLPPCQQKKEQQSPTPCGLVPLNSAD
jgi:hypothetical protein